MSVDGLGGRVGYDMDQEERKRDKFEEGTVFLRRSLL